MTTRLVSENLRSRARMVGTNEEIAQVGTIAANGDKEIGDLIAKAIKEVGKDGPIMIFVLENPLILLHEKKLSDFNILMNLLAVATKGRKPVLIVADGVEDDVLSTLFARKLSDGMKVGGSSKADVRRKKKIVTNALNAAKAAMDEGILPGGGGISLLHASKELDKLEITNSSQKIGVQIILNALKMPVHAIASSAGVAGSFVGKLLAQENHDRACEYVDMINSGIVEPLKVISTAFLEAASLVLKELRISDRA
ncbi:Chaperonin CPN60-1 [Citrus sinensis]|nr:Chaperonin CPN60-1 [Citrus sinensis]